MAGGSISQSMDEVIYVGIGVFIIVLLGVLIYEGYAQGASQLSTAYSTTSGVYKNYTTYVGPLPNTYGNVLNLVIFALAFIAVILAIVLALRGAGGRSGGFLKG